MSEEVLIPVKDIYGNHLNPNEMHIDKFNSLKDDVKADNYNPIEVSPVNVFYTPEARSDPRVIVIVPLSVDPDAAYIILDGQNPSTYLMNEISKALETWAITKDPRVLIRIGMRATQLRYRSKNRER